MPQKLNFRPENLTLFFLFSSAELLFFQRVLFFTPLVKHVHTVRYSCLVSEILTRWLLNRVVQIESKACGDYLDTQSVLYSAADGCAVQDHLSVGLCHNKVIYPHQRMLFYFPTNPLVLLGIPKDRVNGRGIMSKVEISYLSEVVEQPVDLCLSGSFNHFQSPSLCPGESFVSSGMFSTMLHLSALLWQGAWSCLIPAGQLNHSPLHAAGCRHQCHDTVN